MSAAGRISIPMQRCKIEEHIVFSRESTKEQKCGAAQA
jgi:hypothetical protein